jgi:hypothetical protein
MLTLGFSAISWIEHYLVHGPGDVQGQPIELDDEFAAFTLKAYEVDKRGQRKIRRAFLSRSKGRSKSGFAAMIECFEALGPCRFDHWAEPGEVSAWGYEYDEGEPVGAPLTYVEILNVATEEGQAGNTYDAVVYMLHEETCSAELRADYGRLDVGLTRINLPNKRGFIEPVTASNESKDGGKSTFIVADETHLWMPPATGKFRLGKMHQTMVRNLLKRKLASGWMLETSTMYAEGEQSVAEGTHAYAKALAKAGRADAKLLFDHRQAAPEWDLEKRSERLKALREAYGPAAAWMDLQAIADYWDDPQATHAEFRRFWLNQPVPLVAVEKPSVFSAGAWERCKRKTTTGTPLPPLGVPIGLGIGASLDGVWVSLGATLASALPHLGSVLRVRVDQQRDAFVSEVKRIQDEHHPPVAVDAKGPAAFLIPALEAGGVTVTRGGLDDFIQACADLTTAVEGQEVEHDGYDDLDEAVAAADWRAVGEARRAFGRKSGDISALEAVTWSKWAADQPVDTGPNIW